MKLYFGVILLIGSHAWSSIMSIVWAQDEPWWARLLLMAMIVSGGVLLMIIGDEHNDLKKRVSKLENKT